MIFGKTIGLLENLLDLRAKRHNLILSNIANQDTPHYKAKDLNFIDELRSAVKSDGGNLTATSPGHIGWNGGGTHVEGRIITKPSMTIGLDQNSVNIDRELADLAENGIMYNATAQIIGSKFKMLKNAIREGR